MKLLAFSDIHRNIAAVQALDGAAAGADVVVGAGDFATGRRGLEPVIDAIAALGRPTVLVHGNSESEEELRAAAEAHAHLHVLHGQALTLGGVTFFGLGGAVPETPFGAWSVDMSEEEAAAVLAGCPRGAVLVSHSPPKGHCDRASFGRSLGSRAVLECVERCAARLVLCGHIHGAWGSESRVGESRVINLGPRGMLLEIAPDR